MRCPLWPCDTEYAIDPAIWRHDSYKRTPDQLATDVKDMTTDTGSRTVNLTGGEPFMQDHDTLEKFISRLNRSYTIECFSNGSYIYPPWALQRIHFVMDWKLTGSGEANTALENRTVNAHRLMDKDAIKFVVTSFDDLKEALEVYNTLFAYNPLPQFWCGPAWGKMEASDIAEFIKGYALNWKLNVQVHNYVYEPQERGR